MNQLNKYYKGFDNIGNTCYLNSGLQLIIHNKDLCNLILQNASTNPFFDYISNFIKLYYNDKTINSLTPNYIKDLVSKNNKEFIGSNQNDAFEFIIYFLELINSILKNKLYEINIKIIIKCKFNTCLNISTSYEKTNFLLLDINNDTNNLDDCYRNYKSSEKLDNDNLYFCEKCNEKRIASKRNEINEWSQHLIIILKRFIHNNNVKKNIKKISIPILWRHNYKLKGIIFHSGTLTGGHYIYIGEHNNDWIMFNDNFTNKILLEHLDNYKDFGYVYYFQKCY